MSERRFAAVDLGAESGRVVLGRFGRRRVDARGGPPLRQSAAVALPDGLHWNLLASSREMLDGLALAVAARAAGRRRDRRLGFDYALLDGDSRLLGLPFHYRDARTRRG